MIRSDTSRPARPYAFASSTCPRSQLQASAIAAARGSVTSPVRPVLDGHGDPPRVRGRDDRLLGAVGLVGDHPVVLVDGRVVDGEAGRVELGQLVVADAAGEGGAAVEPALARDRLESLAVGAVACDHDAQRRIERGRLEEQVDPLRPVEPVDGEDEVVVAVGAVRQLLRRRQQRLRLQPERPLEPVGDVAGDREEPPGLAERDPVQVVDRAPQRPVRRFFGKLPQIGSVELVRLPELMDEPDDLVRVADHVGGELRRDHEVDGPAVRLLEVDEPPEERLREDAGARIPLERDRDEIGVVPVLLQLEREPLREQLRPAALERDLRRADRNSHCAGLQLGLELRDPRVEVVDEAEDRRVEGALVVGERLDVPAHQLAEDGLDRRPGAAAHPGSKAQVAVGRDGPEPLRLVPERVPLRGARAGVDARRGAGARHLLTEPRVERGHIDLWSW